MKITNINGYDPYATARKDDYYDEVKGKRAVDFIEKYCVHDSGQWRNKKVQLQPWQINYIKTLFGWQNKDGLRRYRKSVLYVGKRNGKSFLATCIGLYMLIADGEGSPLIVNVASESKQAKKTIYDVARHILKQPCFQSKKIDCKENEIRVPKNNGCWNWLTSSGESKHGGDYHFVILDEIWSYDRIKFERLYVALTSSVGSRQQPLILCTSHAGYDVNGIGYEILDYARQVKTGIIEDPTVLPCMYEVPESDLDNWDKIETLQKSCPNYGISLQKDFVEDKIRAAKNSTFEKNNYIRFYLNQWTTCIQNWLSLEDYKLCVNDNAKIPDGHEVILGIDLGYSNDMTAVVTVAKVDDKFVIEPMYFVPRDSAIDKTKEHKIPYMKWIDQKLIITNPGTVIEHNYIFDYIKTLANKYKIREVIFDPQMAVGLKQWIENEGIKCIDFYQNPQNWTSPCMFYERCLKQKILSYKDNPVYKWNVDNAQVDILPSGAITINKKHHKANKKVDGLCASILALSRFELEDKPKTEWDGNIMWFSFGDTE